MNEIFHSVFSVSILPTHSTPIQYESHIHDHALNLPYSAIKTPDITSTIATQTNKSYHTQSIHEPDSRKSRNSSTTLHVFPQPLSHHREPWRWYLQSCSNDVPSLTDESLSTPSTPSRTYPDSRCSTHSSPRPEGGSMDYKNANRCFWPPNTAFPTAPRSQRIDRVSRC